MAALDEWLMLTAATMAGAIAAVSGFGIGSLLTPLLMLSTSPAHAVAVVAVPHAVATTVRWFRLRQQVHVPTFRQFGLASALGGVCGAVLQGQLASPALTVILAALLILAGTTELAGRRVPLPRTPPWRLAGGLVSWSFGVDGNQGGIRAAARLDSNVAAHLVATATASALLVDAARVPVYLLTASDAMSSSLRPIALLSIGATIGTLVGVPVSGASLPTPIGGWSAACSSFWARHWRWRPRADRAAPASDQP